MGLTAASNGAISETLGLGLNVTPGCDNLSMEILIALIGIAIGFAVGYFIFHKDASSPTDQPIEDLAPSLAAAEATVMELRSQLADAKSRIDANDAREKAAAELESKFLQELRPMQQRLQEVQEKVGEVERERIDQFNTIKEQLVASRAQQETLSKNTQALAGALTNNQVRGKWGELTLRRLLEQSGMRTGVDFIEQFNTTNEDGSRIKPDVVILMPDAKSVAVDSKVPFNNFQRAFEIPEISDVTDEKRRKDLLKEHSKDVKKHIDEISKKEYFSGLENSPEFTIMFMPSESLLSVTLEYDPTLLEYAFDRKVALVSPVSFFSVLRTINYGWRQSAQEATIKEVIDLGVRLHKYVRIVAEHALNLGKKLNESVQEYNKFSTSLESSLLTATREVNRRSKSILDQGKVIPQLAELEQGTRGFTKPELGPAEDNEEDSI